MGKTLFISDFDDTLAQTDSKVYLTRNGERHEMTPADYATYEEQPGDEFDFSEFDELINPRPIKRFVRILKKAIEKGAADKITILTARRHTRPVAQFLKMHGIESGVTIAALGDADPQAKARYIEKHIQQGYDRVAFIDDSKKNVDAVKQLKDKYPQVRMVVHHAQEHAKDEKPPEQVVSTQDKDQLSDLLDTTTIRNPETGNEIKLRSALNYGKDHPLHQAALRQLQQLRKK